MKSLDTQALIDAYCEHFQLNRHELAQLDGQRHERINDEFDRFFTDREYSAENLLAFYRESEFISLGLLHCAISEIQTGQARWLQQCIRRRYAASVLDYGCGMSAGVGPLSDEMTVTLADVGRHIGFLSRGYPKATVTALDTISGEFDAVVCLEVLEHTTNPEKTMRRCLGFLAPGGRAYFSWTFAGSGGNHTHLPENCAVWTDQKMLNAIQEAGGIREGGFGHTSVWRRD